MKVCKLYAYSTKSNYEDKISRGEIPWVKLGCTVNIVADRVKNQDNESNPEPLEVKKIWFVPESEFLNHIHAYDKYVHYIMKSKHNIINLRKEWFVCSVEDIDNILNILWFGIPAIKPVIKKKLKKQEEIFIKDSQRQDEYYKRIEKEEEEKIEEEVKIEELKKEVKYKTIRIFDWIKFLLMGVFMVPLLYLVSYAIIFVISGFETDISGYAWFMAVVVYSLMGMMLQEEWDLKMYVQRQVE